MNTKINKTSLLEKKKLDESPIFEDLLLKLKTVTLSQLDEAKASAKKKNTSVSEALVQKSFVSSAEVEAISLLHKNYEKKYQEEKRVPNQERRRGRDRRSQGRRDSDESLSGEQPIERIFRASNALAKYQIIEEISRGGMGIVYKAKDLDLQRIVAIKIIREILDSQKSQILRFQQEGEVLAQLQHPNIVPIYDTGTSDGVKYLVMKYINGVTLDEYIHNESYPLTPKIVIELMIKINKAVHYMHQNKILHRDLKPSNIMIDLDGEPHIMDFGLAKSLAENDRNITRCGITMGTPSYISPEQALGDNANLTERADIYTLGGILYEALTLHPPFQGKNVINVLNQVIYEEVKPPHCYNMHINKDLEAVCLKALAKKPRDRYATAAEYAADLERILKGQAVLAKLKNMDFKQWLSTWWGTICAGIFLIIVYWWTLPNSQSQQDSNLLMRGFESYLGGNLQAAHELSNQSLKASPKDFNAYLLRGKINYLNGNVAAALNDIQKFLQFEPNSKVGLELLQQFESKKK